MLNEFESCSSRLFRQKSTHSPCSACGRKRVGWIWCKCNQNLERNESARRVSFVGTRYSIARSFAKDDDTYSLHRTGVGVCSNELLCVAFASSRNFTRGSTPRIGTLCIIFLIFTQTFPCACRVCVPISVANGQKKWPPNANTHTHTHTHSLSFIY